MLQKTQSTGVDWEEKFIGSVVGICDNCKLCHFSLLASDVLFASCTSVACTSVGFSTSGYVAQ